MALADRPAGCGEVARSGCSFAWNFSQTRSTVFVEAERRHYTKHDTVSALVTRS